MNPWELFLHLLGWLCLGLLVWGIIAVFILSPIKKFRQKRADAKRSKAMADHPSKAVPTDEQVIRMSREESVVKYRLDLLFGELRAREFEAGVIFALEAKRGDSSE